MSLNAQKIHEIILTFSFIAQKFVIFKHKSQHSMHIKLSKTWGGLLIFYCKQE